MKTPNHTGPYYVLQTWGPQPQGRFTVTRSAARARSALRAFARAQRDNGFYAASRLRVLRCENSIAVQLAMEADFGTVPAGCAHLSVEDL